MKDCKILHSTMAMKKSGMRFKKVNDGTSMAEKRLLSIKLYAKHRTKRKYSLDPMDGVHRRAGIFQASFCAQLNPEDDPVSDWLTYTPEDFRTAIMTPDVSITAEHIMEFTIPQSSRAP